MISVNCMNCSVRGFGKLCWMIYIRQYRELMLCMLNQLIKLCMCYGVLLFVMFSSILSGCIMMNRKVVKLMVGQFYELINSILLIRRINSIFDKCFRCFLKIREFLLMRVGGLIMGGVGMLGLLVVSDFGGVMFDIGVGGVFGGVLIMLVSFNFV